MQKIKLMNKFYLIIVISILTISALSSQNSKFSYHLNTGWGFLGDGDLPALSLENELTYNIDHYFSTSVILGIGRNLVTEHAQSDYLLGSLDLYISPFKNNRRNNFKLGGGYSYIDISNTYVIVRYYDNGTKYDFYDYYTNRQHAFNITVEDEFKINSRYMVGIKAYIIGNKDQGGILSGFSFKLGIAL